MWKEGYVSGSEGQLNPDSNLARAEAAQLLYNTMGELFDEDMNSIPWTPIGYPRPDEDEGTEFLGDYNGNNKAIRNLRINLSDRGIIQAGLFWKIGKDGNDAQKAGKVSNIKLDNVDITGNSR